VTGRSELPRRSGAGRSRLAAGTVPEPDVCVHRAEVRSTLGSESILLGFQSDGCRDARSAGAPESVGRQSSFPISTYSSISRPRPGGRSNTSSKRLTGAKGISSLNVDSHSSLVHWANLSCNSSVAYSPSSPLRTGSRTGLGGRVRRVGAPELLFDAGDAHEFAIAGSVNVMSRLEEVLPGTVVVVGYLPFDGPGPLLTRRHREDVRHRHFQVLSTVTSVSAE